MNLPRTVTTVLQIEMNVLSLHVKAQSCFPPVAPTLLRNRAETFCSAFQG